MTVMALQELPSATISPDYGRLRQETASTGARGDEIEKLVDEVLPDSSLQPALSVLKNLVKQFMSKRDAHGLTVKPDTALAMTGVRQAIDANPQLANPELVKSLTNTALHSGE